MSQHITEGPGRHSYDPDQCWCSPESRDTPAAPTTPEPTTKAGRAYLYGESIPGYGHTFRDRRDAILAIEAEASHPPASGDATEPIEPTEFPCPNCGQGIVLRGHFDHSAATPPERSGLDVERLVDILDEAEGDGIIGPDYTPPRLAEYIIARLSSGGEDTPA